MAARKSNAPRFSERDGRELAVSMLHDLEDSGGDAASVEARYRPDGAPQDNIVLRYLEMLRAKNCPELDAGFTAILSDFLGCALAGCVADPEYYEPLIDGDVTPAA